ncbi:MAG TPA: hypothetical protein DD435_09000 [Cyanobacteria bacterium UBA8530]|nr:hypothetical protein [Cyanobacteria bacterium UBA8530]
MGNIQESPLSSLLRLPELREFGQRKKSLPRFCLSCEVKAWCNGGCPKDRIKLSPDGEPGLNYLCAGLQRFFRHSRPLMEILASRWLAAQK